jgi:glycosyltransferase involved in cell wall biosynthesis
MKVALVHYWLLGMRGGEKVLDAICDLYPNADIFTHVVKPERLSETLRSHKTITSFISRLPWASDWYKLYLPLMPMALESLDLRGYDLIISSESGPAKGIVPPPRATHVCYCHSPMRYVWNMYHDYRDDAGSATRLLMPMLAHYMRAWDSGSAARVDAFVANSANVADRIRKYYRRDSTVVYPPVDTEAFEVAPGADLSDTYLMVGELVRYKRPDLVVDAFNASGRPLVVIGGGDMLGQLQRCAAPNVRILGPQPFEVLKHHYARCRALLFPGEEDFGIVPVEAMASGRPVVALGRGGATETVVDGLTGVLFGEQTLEALECAIRRAESIAFDAHLIRQHARRFSRARFEREMRSVIDEAVQGAQGSRRGNRIADISGVERVFA